MAVVFLWYSFNPSTWTCSHEYFFENSQSNWPRSDQQRGSAICKGNSRCGSAALYTRIIVYNYLLGRVDRVYDTVGLNSTCILEDTSLQIAFWKLLLSSRHEHGMMAAPQISIPSTVGHLRDGRNCSSCNIMRCPTVYGLNKRHIISNSNWYLVDLCENLTSLQIRCCQCALICNLYMWRKILLRMVQCKWRYCMYINCCMRPWYRLPHKLFNQPLFLNKLYISRFFNAQYLNS